MLFQFRHISIVMLALTALGSCAGNSGKTADSANTVSADTKPTAPAPVFDADSAFAYTARQVDMGPRISGTAPHSKCRDFIVGCLNAWGADTVSIQKGTMISGHGNKVPVENIFARFNSSATRRVLLVAHYDTRPWADNDSDESNRQKPVPGANDGASGVAVLLEIARQIGSSDTGTGVDFLFTDAEDMGISGDDGAEESWCLGTQMWTSDMPYTAANRPAYGILLDMVGNRDAVFRREYISERYAREVNNRVWANARAAGYESRFIDALGGAVTDDHTFINRAGIPCIDIVDCVNPQTGSFPTDWHTVGDDMSNISAQTLKAVGQTVLNTITSEKISQK